MKCPNCGETSRIRENFSICSVLKVPFEKFADEKA